MRMDISYGANRSCLQRQHLLSKWTASDYASRSDGTESRTPPAQRRRAKDLASLPLMFVALEVGPKCRRCPGPMKQKSIRTCAAVLYSGHRVSPHSPQAVDWSDSLQTANACPSRVNLPGILGAGGSVVAKASLSG
jgi:hypothetical protein